MRATYIEPDHIAASPSRRSMNEGGARALEQLQGARTSNKALRLEMAEGDNGATWIYRLRQAAKRLGVKLDIRCEYQRREGYAKPQPQVIYAILEEPQVAIQAVKRQSPSANGMGITISPAPVQIIGGVEISR